MGTNYYWHGRPCDHYGRFERIHVGKKSMGWTFHFQAYPHVAIAHDENGEPVDFWPVSPFGMPVLSRVDWRKVFHRPGLLYDEYHRWIEDPLDWLDQWDPPSPEEQQEEWSPERMGKWWKLDPEREWRDAEGFSFYAGDFS